MLEKFPLCLANDLFTKQVEDAYLLRKNKIRKINKGTDDDNVTLGERIAALKNAVLMIQCLHIFVSFCFFYMDIWHDGALIFLSNWPKLLNIAFVIIAGITGVMGTLLNRPTFILLFLFIQAVILFYIVSVALIMILTAIVMDGTFDKLLFITNINFGVTYGVLLYMVYKYWRQVSRTYLPRLHKTITVKKTHIRFSNEFLPMTPEIRIHNPVREVELVVPNSPTLPLYTDSFRSDESPVVFPEYKQSSFC